jgi:hypothetical protein
MITTKYLKETIKDAQSKVGSQHAIDKEKLIEICQELIWYRTDPAVMTAEHRKEDK